MTELLTEPNTHLAPSRGLSTTLLAGVAAVAAVVLTTLLLRTIPLDFLTYRYGVQAALRGTNIYQQNVHGPLLAGQPFTYTPFAAVALIPTTFLSWKVSYLLWSAGLVTALWAVLRALLPAHLDRRSLSAAALTAAAATTCVIVSNLHNGQIDIPLMGLCLGDLLRRRNSALGRALPRGVLVGLAAAVKLTPALFIVYFVLTRQWRLAATSAGSAAAATVLGALAFPRMTATFAGHVLWTLTSRVDLGHPLGYWANSSLTGAIHALGPWAVPLAAPAVAAAAALCLAAAVRCHRRGAELHAWLIIGLTAPALSPFSWDHHFVYLIPALVVLGQAALASDQPTRRRPLLAAAAVVLTALDLGPDVGHWLLTLHISWLDVPGLMLRESLLLSSFGAIAALSHRPATLKPPGAAPRPDPAHRAEDRRLFQLSVA